MVHPHLKKNPNASEVGAEMLNGKEYDQGVGVQDHPIPRAIVDQFMGDDMKIIPFDNVMVDLDMRNDVNDLEKVDEILEPIIDSILIDSVVPLLGWNSNVGVANSVNLIGLNDSSLTSNMVMDVECLDGDQPQSQALFGLNQKVSNIF